MSTAALAGGVEDDAYLIPRTLEEQAEYDQERLEQARAREADQANERRDDGSPSLQHFDAVGARVWACRVYDQIQQGKREPFPARSRYIGNFKARPTQGARRPVPDWVGKDQLHYGDSDPNNHG